MASPATSHHKDVILSTAGITATLVLAEPVVYLYGFSKSEQRERPPAIVRGSLVLRITKPTKMKTISLKFRGISRTEWPEGIPSEKSETHETKEVFSHEWRFFSSQFTNADQSSGAHQVVQLDPETVGDEADGGSHSLLSAALHPHTSSTPHSLVNQHDAVAKGYRVFHPAEYVYNFELLLPQRLPETLKCNFGHVKWGFSLAIDRPGTFKTKLTGHRDFTVLRSLGQSNLESSEPIVISRDWEDLLHYEIIIAGKAFAIGQSFNIAFSLVPMAKVRCHRIRLYITEHVEYYCRNRRIHRVEPSHKFMLLEQPPKGDSKTNILETSESGIAGLTELEFNVKIPETFPNRRDHLRPNANTEYIKVHHWIKAIMRLSRIDTKVEGKPKCYEVSIDSPITLVDTRTTLANELPQYQGSGSASAGDMVEDLRPYQEFIQKGDPLLPVQRAILFTRQPSIAPPPFDADVQPPQLQPPPTYDQLRADPGSYQTRYIEHLRLTGQHDAADSMRETEGTTTSDSHSTASSGKGSTPPSSMDETMPAVPSAAQSVDLTNMYVSTPVFSEIIWTEDGDALNGPGAGPDSSTGNYDDDVDPRMPQVTHIQRDASAPPEAESTPTPPGSYVGGPFMDAFTPVVPPAAVVPGRFPGLGAEAESPRIGHTDRLVEVRDVPPLPTNPAATSSATISTATTSTATTSIATTSTITISNRPDSDGEPDPRAAAPQPSPTSRATPFGSAGAPGHRSITPIHPAAEFDPADSPISPTATPAFPFIDDEMAPLAKVDSASSRTAGSAGSGSVFRTSMGAAASPRRGDDPESPSSVRAGPFAKRYPVGAAPGSVPGRVPSQMQMQRLRGVPAAAAASRRSSIQSGKVSIKSPQSAGPAVGPVWTDTAQSQLFGDRWMEPVSSAGSAAAPRFFRQSSIVSIDLVRQGQTEAAFAESQHASRRVSEVSEVTEWYPLSRNNSEASVAFSVTEYEAFADHPAGSQGRAPLLGDTESVDMASAFGRFDDYDYDLEDDNRSVSSALYSVLTP